MLDYQKFLEETFDQVERIGAGGGGIVFKAYHRRLQMNVILKKIRSNQLDTVDRRRELNILKSLKHPYIPQVYDFIEFGHDVFTVMEFIEGASFAQFLSKGVKFSQTDVCKWLRQLCEVVTYLHSQTPQILHCDIKPANVMLTPKGDICLIDFNVSDVKSEERASAVGYSEGYAPAEQFALIAQRLKRTAEQHSGNSMALLPQAASNAEIDTELTEIADDITQIQDDDRTEVGSMPVLPVASRMPIHRSLIRAMSDSQWEKANQMSAFLGNQVVLDERTDIYSIGATMYHILTSERPRPFYMPYLPVESVRQDVGESLAFILNKALQLKPQDRFGSSAEFLKAVNHMEMYDSRYKRLQRQQIVISFLTACLFVVSVGCASLGWRILGEEKLKNDYAHMSGLFEKKEYEACIASLSESGYLDFSGETEGDFFYLAASCYFELEDYANACDYYQEAVACQPENVFYYRDYVVSLARLGKTKQAETVLKQAIEQGLQNGEINLLCGEISFMNGNCKEAAEYFAACIEGTEDDYLLLRAYTKLDEVYQQLYQGEEQYKKRADLLSDGIDTLPQERQTTLLGLRAGIYTKWGDDLLKEQEDAKRYFVSALDDYRVLEERHYITFVDEINVVVLYEKMGEFQKAKNRIDTMISRYPENYKVYARAAFVELEIQNELEPDARNYKSFAAYYEKAEAYAEAVVGEDSDMMYLETYHEQLVQNGWISD